MFDSIGYAGTGRRGLALCIAAFEAGDTEKFSPEIHEQYFNRVLGVMFGMTLLMNGDVK